jgi:hydrophobe/amphiphile efflux-3 (HAE3) family protein
MLDRLGQIIEQKPGRIVILILLITIGFGIFIPSIQMETSMEHFLPDDPVVQAQQRMNNYFGAGYQTIMVLAEDKTSNGVTQPTTLKKIYSLQKEIEQEPEVAGTISIAGFVDTLCQLEFNKSLENCSTDEITLAFQDLMSESNTTPVQMLASPDPNEAVDYPGYRYISRGKSIDSLDIKNYYIETQSDRYCFSIEVYNLSAFKTALESPDRTLNVIEWYIDFHNLIISNKDLDLEYRIAAHIEPTSTLWDVGQRPLNNIRDIVTYIREHSLFKSFTKIPILWLKPPGQDVFFPVTLETGNIVFNTTTNRVEIYVEKAELGQYGLAPEMNGFGLLARIGDSQAGVRYFKNPVLKLPWMRVSFNMSFLQRLVEKITNKPVLSRLSERVLGRFGSFSLSDISMVFQTQNQTGMTTDAITLTDLDTSWITLDVAPDTGVSSTTVLIKPSFIEGIKSSAITFLSQDYSPDNSAYATLILVQVNGSLDEQELDAASDQIDHIVSNVNSASTTVSFRATGSSIMNSEINDVMMQANEILIPLIFVVISIILLVSFRRISYVLLPLLGLSIAIIWLFGTMAILHMPFMIIEVALIPMMMGLGVDYSVHLFHNYRTELLKGKTPGKAIVASIQDIGIAMLLATITTFIAFLSFLTATMIPLRDFGILCAIGIAYIFIITITLQAALRYIIDRRKGVSEKIKSKRDPNGQIMKKIASVICYHPRIVLLITILISIALIGGAFQIKTGFTMEDFLPAENQSVIVMNDIAKEFPFSSQEQEYILIEGDVATRETLIGINQATERFSDDTYILRTPDGKPKVQSLLTIIQAACQNNQSLTNTFNIDSRGIPETDADVLHLCTYLYDNSQYAYEVQQTLHKHGSTYDATLITVYTDVMNSNSDDVNKVMGVLYSEFKYDVSGGFGGATAIITGENTMMYIIMNSMTESQIISTVFCMVLAAIVLIIAYRKPLLGLIAMLPVLISTVWIVGTMSYIGYALNVMTIMITSLTIGLGITYAIHAVERFRLIADRTGDVISAVSETIGHTGTALLIAAITTVAGFGILILTPMPVEQQFGLITALTILYAFLTSIFVLPPVLMYWGRYRKKKKGYIISPGSPKRK